MQQELKEAFRLYDKEGKSSQESFSQSRVKLFLLHVELKILFKVFFSWKLIKFDKNIRPCTQIFISIKSCYIFLDKMWVWRESEIRVVLSTL